MDMKRILERLDRATAKPAVADTNDIKKFVNIVTEGANPHKVALPVQMAMQHYASDKNKVVKDSAIRKYFQEAQDQVLEATVERKEHLRMYAQRIAERVMEGSRDAYQRDYDSSVSNMGDEHKRAFKRAEMEHGLGHETNNYAVSINGKTWKVFGTRSHAEAIARKIQMKDPSKKVGVHETGAEISEGVWDTVKQVGGEIKDTLVGKSAEDLAKTSPQMAALIKMRAQYPNNTELERRISDLAFRLNQGGGEVQSYDPKTGQQFSKVPLPPKVQESKKKTLKNSNPCWDGYKPVGTKKKNGRTVPNCVPKK